MISAQHSGRGQRFAYVALLLMGLAATLALGTDVSNYVRSIKSAHGLDLTITDLQVIDDDNPRALIHFRVRNNASLEVEVKRYYFELYLNGERVGSSYSMYTGTDPNIDTEAHRKVTGINQALSPGQDLDLAFTVYFYSTQMESVRRAQRAGTMSWQVSAKFVAVLPYSREENVIELRAGFEE